ncbi:MAG: cytidine deaminase [Clostridia bacterium]|nr:MAG: cytidine deaminase [Clostridia bacterium]
MEPGRLLALAAQVQARAYAPYSGFPVGAALLGISGAVYTGCNVENTAYGLSLCAERAAAVQAVAAGERSFLALAVVAGAGNEGCWPCGACRQFLWEFGDMVVMVPGPDRKPQMRLLSQLLPEPFAIQK